jgi:TrmH family RNA methyltransferase
MTDKTVDKQISSAQNDLYRDWLDCLTTKGIRKHGVYFVSGEKTVSEMLSRFPEMVRSILVGADKSDAPAVHNLIARAREATKLNTPRFSSIELSKELFKALDVSGTHSPLLLMKAPEIKTADLSLEPIGLEILCALGDPANVGALLRSAAAFGASKVIFLKESSSPLHPKAVRGASGMTLNTPLFSGPSIIELPALAESGAIKGPVVALDMFGTELKNYVWPRDARLLVGEEGAGIPTSNHFTTVSISMRPGVESLNATVAISIALHSYFAQAKVPARP